MNTLISRECATATPVEIVRLSGDTAVARVRPDADDPVYAGHYPGFPLLPGVYMVEFAHRAVLAVEPDLVLAEIVSCRFLVPVDRGSELAVTVRRDGDVRTATVGVPDGPVTAELVLRYDRES